MILQEQARFHCLAYAYSSCEIKDLNSMPTKDPERLNRVGDEVRLERQS